MRRRGSDRAVCAYLKQPNAMAQGARRTDRLSSPTACSSTMRSSNACTKGGSTTGAWPRCPVALGVVGTCRLLRSSSWLAFLFIHFKAWSALAVPERGSGTGPSPPSLEERVAPDSPGRLSALARYSPLARRWPSQLL